MKNPGISFYWRRGRSRGGDSFVVRVSRRNISVRVSENLGGARGPALQVGCRAAPLEPPVLAGGPGTYGKRQEDRLRVRPFVHGVEVVDFERTADLVASDILENRKRKQLI